MTDQTADRPFAAESTEVLRAALGLASRHAEQAARFRPAQPDGTLPAVVGLLRAELQHREETLLPPPEGPEYTPCSNCTHIEPDHQPDAGPCMVCDCRAYEPAAVSAAVAPPTNQTVAEAVLAAVEAALCDTLLPDAREEALDRLMKVLPPTTDRAAILREAADRAEVVALRLRLKHDTGAANGAYEVMDELRRMADETATETPAAEPTAEDIAREHVTSLHLIGEQLATIESWFWEHLSDVRDAGARQDGAQP